MSLPLPTMLDDYAVQQNLDHIAQQIPSGGIKSVQTKSVDTGSVPTAGASVTVTWPTAFGDTNYVATALVEDSGAQENALEVHHLVSKTPTDATFYVANEPGGNRTGTLHAMSTTDAFRRP